MSVEGLPVVYRGAAHPELLGLVGTVESVLGVGLVRIEFHVPGGHHAMVNVPTVDVSEWSRPRRR